MFDKVASKKYIGTNVISIDPKGFSTNELFLLTAKQCDDGCELGKVEVKDQGALDVPGHTLISLPLEELENMPCTAELLFKGKSKGEWSHHF